MKKLLLAIFAITLMASCAQNEIKNSADPVKVEFSTVVGNNTKAVSTFGVIDLTALKASNDGFGVSTSGLGTGAGEMSNLQVKYVPTAWTYTGSYYWPINPAQNVTFTSYAPYGTNGVSLSATTGLSVTNFIPSTTTANQIDLIYAAPASFNRSTSGTSGVAFTFNHLLTQVVFSITTDIPGTETPTISGITLTIPKGSGSYASGAWTTTVNAQSYTIPFASTTLSSAANVSTPILMLPQSPLPAGTNATITLSLKGGAEVSSNTIDLSTLTSVTSWAAGTKVTYNIVFSNAGLKIKFTDPTVSTWGSASDTITY